MLPEEVRTATQARAIVEERGLAHVKVGVFDNDGILRGKFIDRPKFFAALETELEFRDVVLGYFNWQKKDYKKIPIHEQVEVLSLLGDIAQGDDGPKIHAHVVVGKSDGTAHGGHLLEAHVRPTLEVVLVESPRHLQRQYDPESRLALIRP